MTNACLAPRLVPQIAFEVGDLGAGDQLAVDVLRTQLGAGAEIGVHRPLRVGGDDDQAAAGRTARRSAGVPPKATPSETMSWRKMRAELVVLGLADEGAAAAQRGDGGDGVGGRAAGDLDRRAHRRVERLGALGVDQRHRSLVQAVADEEGVVGLRQHVDDGVADADHVVEAFGHGRSLRLL